MTTPTRDEELERAAEVYGQIHDPVQWHGRFARTDFIAGAQFERNRTAERVAKLEAVVEISRHLKENSRETADDYTGIYSDLCDSLRKALDALSVGRDET